MSNRLKSFKYSGKFPVQKSRKGNPSWNLDLNHPGFVTLRKFILHEFSVMSFDYAQTFFRSEEKDKSCDSGDGRVSVRVRQVAVKSQE